MPAYTDHPQPIPFTRTGTANGFATFIYAASKAKLFLNGEQKDPTQEEEIDSGERIRYDFVHIKLQDGWNHFLIKVAGSVPDLANKSHGASVAIRLRGTNREAMEQLTFATAVSD